MTRAAYRTSGRNGELLDDERVTILTGR